MAEYIEKQAAIDAAIDAAREDGKKISTVAIRIMNDIKAIPAADVVKVRHAKDVYKQYNEHHCEFMCSICGGWIGVIEGGICDFNYCPNCGAKMEVEET